jgi:hypothetical protein
VILEKLSAVLYTADINGEVIKIHAVNMKPECATVGEEMLDEFLPKKFRGSKKCQVLTPEQTLDGGTTGNKRSLSPKNIELDNLRITANEVKEDSTDRIANEFKDDRFERIVVRANSIRKYSNVHNTGKSTVYIEYDIYGDNTDITKRVVTYSAVPDLRDHMVNNYYGYTDHLHGYDYDSDLWQNYSDCD